MKIEAFYKLNGEADDIDKAVIGMKSMFGIEISKVEAEAAPRLASEPKLHGIFSGISSRPKDPAKWFATLQDGPKMTLRLISMLASALQKDPKAMVPFRLIDETLGCGSSMGSKSRGAVNIAYRAMKGRHLSESDPDHDRIAAEYKAMLWEEVGGSVKSYRPLPGIHEVISKLWPGMTTDELASLCSSEAVKQVPALVEQPKRVFRPDRIYRHPKMSALLSAVGEHVTRKRGGGRAKGDDLAFAQHVRDRYAGGDFKYAVAAEGVPGEVAERLLSFVRTYEAAEVKRNTLRDEFTEGEMLPGLGKPV